MKSAEEFLRQFSADDVEACSTTERDLQHENAELAELARKIENRAVALLAIREHGARELKAKLLSKFPETDELLAECQESAGLVGRVVEQVIEHCQQRNWQSDDRYIEQAVHSLMEKGQGPLKIRQKLQQACERSDLIEAHLEMDQADWLDRIQAVLLKKYGETARPQNRNEQAKRMRFLQSRGFPPELIWKAFR
ncbi:MAG: regulatory protein RecX [Thiomicrorhabdus chilensis]|uniref:regulatory protein RecX n=1 Tax=Thiomicrorhabdus chilensis TaxID=63656 RepID=UPI00299DE240|nr:regulatory protein RecX [Thiomicrorhabdus chilensis]MDX1348387.1 regulatory protein RecX [Thiomicrorhabdus chilensis]